MASLVTAPSNAERPAAAHLRLSWQLSLAVVGVVLGITIALLFRTQASQGFPLAQQSTGTLAALLKQQDEVNDRLRATIAVQRTELDRYEHQAAAGRSLSRVAQSELRRFKMAAGLVPLAGPGVVVTLNDSTQPPTSLADAQYKLVHDYNLREIVNELWASGAEAIAINGQRYVADTPIRCVGPVILVNEQRVAPPYRVVAIGPGQTMESALQMPGGVIDAMGPQIASGVRVRMAMEQVLRVPAIPALPTYRYAKAAQ
ncbi:MAG TPA: DUF881 domain-containing protein [Candidatus Dormibacteraeota bacterium]|nr:DUF881 domain-containing protein [Candidatus Dormibacteraeota bacterium]